MHGLGLVQTSPEKTGIGTDWALQNLSLSDVFKAKTYISDQAGYFFRPEFMGLTGPMKFKSGLSVYKAKNYGPGRILWNLNPAGYFLGKNLWARPDICFDKKLWAILYIIYLKARKYGLDYEILS